MDNLNQSLEKSDQASQNKASWPLITFIIVVIIAIGVAWQFTGDKSEPVVVDEPVLIVEEVAEIVEEVPEPVIEIPEVTVIDEEIIEPVKDPLPLLDNSDDWLKLKLPEITWRKELLKLIIDEDMVRRFVVFTDNFSQGLVAYEHSPFAAPVSSFSALENKKSDNSTELLWDENSARRFTLYVDLLRSFDSTTLVEWYIELKPLINQAYGELGYPDEDFTEVLQSAITRVLDMELPKEPLALERPSVMYRFKNKSIESLDDSDKLLLRLGKENLLIIKSVLLEINEKLSREVGI